MTTIFLISFVPPDPELGVATLTWSPGRYSRRHGRNIQWTTERRRLARNRLRKHTVEVTARRLLKIVVYDKASDRRDATLDDLVETEVGDWKMSDFKAACTYAADRPGRCAYADHGAAGGGIGRPTRNRAGDAAIRRDGHA